MSEYQRWTDRARKLVDYHREALDFISRAGNQLPTSYADALALSRLWLEAEDLDDMVCSLLNEVNEDLLGGEQEVDATRGASMRRSDMGVGDEYLTYECSWSLVWEEEQGISVTLALEPSSRTYEVQVLGLKSSYSRYLRFPMREEELKEALTDAYVSEATA